MNFYLHGLHVTNRQQIKLHGTTKKRTLSPQTKLTFLEIGRNDVEIVGVYSQDLSINQIHELKLHFNDVKGLGFEERIKWFKQNFPKAIIFEIALEDIENLLEWEDKNKIISRPITIESSAELKWDK